MGEFSALVARALGCDQRYCDLIQLASQMHDLGKIGIPDAILQKPGKLTESEWAVMRTHPEIGARLLQGSDDELFQLAAEVALTHHEKFDGSGYPRGLRSRDIPLSGRIVAIADFFDAVTMDRCYRPAMHDDEAFALLRSGSGAHFDPDVVEAFFRAREAIIAARARARCGEAARP
jgi:putative two-component system response regulator